MNGDVVDVTNLSNWQKLSKRSKSNQLSSPITSRKSSDPPSPGSLSNNVSGISLCRAFLDQESPQLNATIVEFLLSSDSNLSTFLDFIVRPIGSNPHAISSLGQDALAAIAAKTINRAMSSRSMRNGNSTSGIEKLQNSDRTIVSMVDSHELNVDYSVYGVSNFAVEAALGAGTRLANSNSNSSSHPYSSSSSSSSLSVSSVLPMSSIKNDSIQQQIQSISHDDDDDGEPIGETDDSTVINSGNIGNLASSTSAMSESIAISRAIIQAHTATFSAAVADLANVKDVFLMQQDSATLFSSSSSSSLSASSSTTASGGLSSPTPFSKNVTSMTVSSNISTPVSSMLATREEINSTSTSSPASSSSRLPQNASLLNQVRAFSLLTPRNSEVIEALGNLATQVSDAETKKSIDNDIFALPSSTELKLEEENEIACVKRSYRAMRILCTGSVLGDEVTSQRVKEITRSMLSVFSSRNKGSFSHACAVLQKLIQVKPDEMAAFLIEDSQRHLGGMLNFLHHAPVADTLLQLVTVNHLSSASGGAGPNATLNGPTGSNGPNNGGFANGRGMVGGGLAFLSNLSGLSGGGDTKPTLTTYNAPLMIYGTRASMTTVPLPLTRGNLIKNLAGWGFLSVLAAHIYRPEFAASHDHAENAANALLFLIHLWASEERAESLFQIFSSDPRVLRGLSTAATNPRPGIDFDPSAQQGDAFSHIPSRQRASMRVLSDLAILSFKPRIPQTTDAAGVPLQINVQPALLDNRLYKQASSIGEAVVAILPRLAATLGVIHKQVHPDVLVANQKKALSHVLPILPGTVGNASSAEKKKKKKKKKSQGGGGAGGGGGGGPIAANSQQNSNGTLSATTIATKKEGTQDDEEDETEDGGHSSLSQSGSPIASHNENPSIALVPMPIVALPPPALLTTSSTTSSGRTSPNLVKTSSSNSLPSQQQAHQLRHCIPFGFYRLHAIQLLSLVLNESGVKVQPPLRGVSLLEVADLEKGEYTTAPLLSEDTHDTQSSLETSRSESLVHTEDHATVNENENVIASLTACVNALSIESNVVGIDETTNTHEEDDGNEDEDDEDEDDDLASQRSNSSSIIRRRGGGHGGRNNSKKKNKKYGKKSKKSMERLSSSSSSSSASSSLSSEITTSSSSPVSSIKPTADNLDHSRSMTVSQASFAALSTAILLLPRRAIEILRKVNKESKDVNNHLQHSTITETTQIETKLAASLPSSLSVPSSISSRGKLEKFEKIDDSFSSTSSTSRIQTPSSRFVLEGIDTSLVAKAVVSFTQRAVTTSAAAGGQMLLSPVTGLPLVYDPLDLWGCLCTWVTLYSNTNLYHVAFLDIITSMLTKNSDENTAKAQFVMFSGAKLISSFIKHYVEQKPCPPNDLKSRFVSLSNYNLGYTPFNRQMVPFEPAILGSSSGRGRGGGEEEGSTTVSVINANQSSRRDGEKSTARPSSLSTAHSSARGVILQTLDLVRSLVSNDDTKVNTHANNNNNSSDVQQHQFLRQHLRDHTLWVDFQEKLKADIALISYPLIPQQNNRGNTNATGGGGEGGGGRGINRSISDTSNSSSSISSSTDTFSRLQSFWTPTKNMLGFGQNNSLIGKQTGARGLTSQANLTSVGGVGTFSSDQGVSDKGLSVAERAEQAAKLRTDQAVEHAVKARASMIANRLMKKKVTEATATSLLLPSAISKIKAPVENTITNEEARTTAETSTVEGWNDSESPPISNLTSSDLLDVD